MTEDQFKELTGSLETVGHYVPTVRDMFQFLVDRKGYLRVHPESPKAWRGYAGVKLNEGEDAGGLDLDYFPEAGRFEAPIKALLCSKTTMDEKATSHTYEVYQYEAMAKEFGLELQLTSTTWSAQFVLTLPAEELIAEFEKYEALVNKL